MKIFTLDELSAISSRLKDEGKMIVMAHGCYDLLHIGHVQHLKAAKRLGDVLVVTITADEFVNKGPDRPAFPEDDRAAMVEALECVDYIAINNSGDSSDAILAIKPDRYVKGIDYVGMSPDIEQIAVQRIGGKVMFTTTEKHSSTDLIERYLR